MELVSFIFLFTLLTTSIIGYGLLFSLKFSKYNNFTKEKISIGYIGIFGIIFSIFISYLTNLFLPHNNLHNLFFIIIGITIALIFFFKKKTRFNFNFFLIAYFINFIALLYFKNHDDFSYYHLSFISNINQNKIEFGLSHFDVAFNHNSSLFYFHSLFNTYLTNDYFYHLGPYSIVIFTNAILLEKIFNDSKKNNLNTSFYLSLFFLVFINIFFYRLAEHGTDRSAQILFFLAVILVVNMFDLKKFSNNTFELLLIIFTLIITIKSFYILYLLLLFYVYLKYFKIKKLVSFLKSFPIILFCFFTFSLMIVYNISLSGCLIYPLPATCPEVFFWGYGYEKVSDYQTWYELWSKSGASPNYIVEDIPKYLSGFNWIPNWLDNYFFNKFSDFLLGIIFTITVFLFVFKPFRCKINLKDLRLFLPLYLLIIILFIEWFFQHPALRYGGFVLVYLIMTLPISLLLKNQNFTFLKKKKQINVLILIIFIIFFSRNISRIDNEKEVYGYNLFLNPNYNIQKYFYTLQNHKINFFKQTNVCLEENSLREVKCKKILGYNFYFVETK